MGDPALGIVMPFADLLVRAAAEVPDKDAVIFPERKVTYRELLDAAVQRAVGLRRLGVEPGEHVGILMANCIEYLEVLFATQLIGALAVTLNARYQPRELTYVIENADLALLVTSDLVADHVDYVQRISAALPQISSSDPFALDREEAPKLRSCVLLGSSTAPGFAAGSLLAPTAAEAEREEIETLRRRVSVRAPAIMMYTSGTTAYP
ncbi:MAG: AMP-binding protein, partial [bacterium]|nr:AMP-binding protein [bacterium]